MIVKINFNVVNLARQTIDYRIYVDSDLIVERMFDVNSFGDIHFTIDEELIVDISEGEHTIKIEQVDYPNPFPPDSIVFQNMRVFGVYIPEGDNKTSICFYA